MDLRTWISDNTIKFLGAADSTIVDYIIAEAQTAKSPDALYNKLSGFGFQGTVGSKFAEELYVKVPRQRKHSISVEKTKHRETTKLIKQSSSYSLLLEPEEETPAPKAKDKEKKQKNEKKSKVRRREDTDDQWASDEEEKQARKRRREQYEEEQWAKYDEEMDEDEKEELRIQDERERDEFAEKMKEKDAAAQRKVQGRYVRHINSQVIEDRSSDARKRGNLADDAAARA